MTAVALWGCSTGTDPVTDSSTLGSVAKVVDSGTKTTKKCTKMMGWLHLLNRTKTACLDLDPDLTWRQDHFLNNKTQNYQDKL